MWTSSARRGAIHGSRGAQALPHFGQAGAQLLSRGGIVQKSENLLAQARRGEVILNKFWDDAALRD